MTNCKLVSWGLWAMLLSAMIVLSACSRDGITAPDATNVGGFTEGGGLEGKELYDFMSEYQAIRDAGGGAKVVETDGYTLLAVFDRWQDKNLHGVFVVQPETGTSSVINTDGVTILKDLDYPITVSAWAEGYVGQTIVNTEATIIVFGLEYFVPGGSGGTVAGIGGGDMLEDASAYAWCTITASTQTGSAVYKNTGWDTFPYSLLNISPWKPAGGVSWLFALQELPQSAVPVHPIHFARPDLNEIPLEDWTCIGYSYDNFGQLMMGMGGWLITYNAVSELNTYSEGSFDFPAPEENNGTLTKMATVSFMGGTMLADTWEFVPNTLPVTIDADETEGTYTVQGVDPPVDGDRRAMRAHIEYFRGGSETQFVEWDPDGDTVPDITFGELPKITSTGMGQGNFITASWDNTPEDGLLVVNVYLNGYKVQSVYVDSEAEGLPEAGVPITPQAFHFLRSLEISVERVAATDVDLNDFDAERIWAGVTSFAESAPVALLPINIS